MENPLKNIHIDPMDIDYYNRAIDRESKLIKPPKSLGVLEDIACKMCGIKREDKPNIDKKRLIVFAADNGVYDENVSSCPQNITLDQTINLTLGITGASSMAKGYNDDIEVYDLGVNADIDKKYNVINKKISKSTKNILIEDAMDIDSLYKSLSIGMEAVKKAHDDKVDIIGLGEMGICNTTTSAAVLSALLDISPDKVTGYGAGLTRDSYLHKIDVIKNSIKRIKSKNILDIIRSVGGYDIAAMCGAYLEAARLHMPVVIDGFISIVAALSAYIYDNNVKDYMYASHESMEPGYKIAIDRLGLRSLFNLDMRLGEGSGCIIAFRIIESALFMHNGMKTFDEVNIDDTYLDKIR